MRSVRITPGAILLTVMPYGASSRAQFSSGSAAPPWSRNRWKPCGRTHLVDAADRHDPPPAIAPHCRRELPDQLESAADIGLKLPLKFGIVILFELHVLLHGGVQDENIRFQAGPSTCSGEPARAVRPGTGRRRRTPPVRRSRAPRRRPAPTPPTDANRAESPPPRPAPASTRSPRPMPRLEPVTRAVCPARENRSSMDFPSIRSNRLSR